MATQLKAPIEARLVEPGRWVVGYHSMGGFHKITDRSFASLAEAQEWMREPFPWGESF